MENLLHPLTIGHLAIALFIAIVFLQSGIDKIVDWKGNLSWLQGHFKSSPLSGVVTPMLAIVTIAEIATGLMAVCGIYCVLACKDATCVKYAVALGLLSLLMLLFGQRIAKDYDGAKTIAIYFGVLLVSLLLFDLTV